MAEIITVRTQPVAGQAPGTSGLRKKTAIFEAGNYLPNFVQSTFDALGEKLAGSTLVVGGDGRYFNSVALSVILKMACANGVSKVIVGKDGILATPALSALIRARTALGGFILTASHNPGGPEADWGIKYNCENGGPAPPEFTEAITEITKTIGEYRICAHSTWPSLNGPGAKLDMGVLGSTTIPGTTFVVEVVDSVEVYQELLWSIFDIPAIQKLCAHPKFTMMFDALNAVTGPYAIKIFHELLGIDASKITNSRALEDFGGLHPDPNLKYAAELVAAMGCAPDGLPVEDPSFAPDFGAASDGDGDRNMVMGRGCFVSPSDSLAIIAAHADCIPYFKGGLKGVARSMPTSGALDRVAKAKEVECFITPTGWKFFGNLMDADRCSICGEESFGTGSDHVREKDGLWAVLAWLNILADQNKDKGEGDALVSVQDVVNNFWATYGRNYYTRYDYEGVTTEAGDALMDHLRSTLDSAPGQSFHEGEFKIQIAEEFTYTDPIDGSVASKQGICFTFEDGSRFIFRLSGTGSSGATIRMYLDKYADPAQPEGLKLSTADALAKLVDIALKVSNLEAISGRSEPTVIT